MVACGYEISLLVFNSKSHSWAIKLNTRREIPYLRVAMCYSLYLNLVLLLSIFSAPAGEEYSVYLIIRF